MKKNIIIYLLLFFQFANSQIKIKTDNFPKFKLSFFSESCYNKKTAKYGCFVNDSIPNISVAINSKKRKVLVAFFTGHEGFYDEVVVGTYYSFANTWQQLHQIILPDCELIGDLDLFSNKEKEYIYFEYMMKGGSSGWTHYSFALYDVFDNKLYELMYYGRLTTLDTDQLGYGEFKYKELLEFPEILKILENKASISKNILR